MKKGKLLKKIFVLFISMNTLLSYTVNSQSWQWVKRSGGTSGDFGENVCTDKSGNVFSIAQFSGKAGFGTVSVGDTLTSYGERDISIVKYNSSGTFQWAKQIGGTSGDYSKSIKTDAAGNIYVGGYFTGSAYFNSTTYITGAGGTDIFIAKYNNAGVLQWVKTAGGSGIDVVWGLTLDNSGNIFIAGYFESTATFGTSTTVTSVGDRDIYLAKYDNSGTFKWVKKAGGGGWDEANSVCVDPSGNPFITGAFANTAIFDTIFLSCSGTADIFTAKYSSTGGILWAKRAGSDGYDYAKQICADKSGSAYIIADFESTAQFGTHSLTSTGDMDFCIAKYNSDGNVEWAKKAGGPYGDFGWAIDCDTLGNTYITGNYYITAYFDTITVSNYYPPSNPNSRDIFLAKYNTNGEAQWAQTAGGTGNDDWGQGICVSSANDLDIFVTGYINSGSYFKNLYVQNPTANGDDIFVGKFIQPVVTNIENIDQQSDDVFIYPNPVANQLNIKFNTNEATNIQLKLTNQIGEIKYFKNILSNGNYNTHITVSSFPKGIYFLQIITKQKIITKKIIIS